MLDLVFWIVLTFFKFFKNLRVNRRVFSCCLLFPKVTAKNIYYCGEKSGEADVAHMVSNYKYQMPLKINDGSKGSGGKQAGRGRGKGGGGRGQTTMNVIVVCTLLFYYECFEK